MPARAKLFVFLISFLRNTGVLSTLTPGVQVCITQVTGSDRHQSSGVRGLPVAHSMDPLAHVPDVLGLVSAGACHTLGACLLLLVAGKPGPAGSSLEQHHASGWAWEKHYGVDAMLVSSGTDVLCSSGLGGAGENGVVPGGAALAL